MPRCSTSLGTDMAAPNPQQSRPRCGICLRPLARVPGESAECRPTDDQLYRCVLGHAWVDRRDDPLGAGWERAEWRDRAPADANGRRHLPSVAGRDLGPGQPDRS